MTEGKSIQSDEMKLTKEIDQINDDRIDINSGNDISITIPSWFVSSALVAFLSLIFVQSLLSPIQPFWNMLGVMRYAIIAGGVLYAILSILFILSADSEGGYVARVGIVGGGIVGIMFGFLGWISVFLAASTALLIYLLSIMILEDDDEVSGDDSCI